MKQKTHSGLKKRVKVRNSGTVAVQKSAKRHLLSNKSKRQKKSNLSGYEIHPTRIQSVRRLMPGQIPLQGKK
jgi:large subunit ribosomal protein L35